MLMDVFDNRHGAQGQLDGASKSTLENQFGTSNEDEVIKEILEKGTVQESEVCLFILHIHPSTKHCSHSTP
jgi:ribosome maturation protein Sdo1